jgi:ParB/RepB/Spo0J family partition protein
MAARDEFARGQTTVMIDPRRVRIKAGLNIRDMTTEAFKAGIEELANSIETQGFLNSHPIEYSKDDEGYYVTAGHRRLLASLRVIERGNVELFAIPALPEAKGTKLVDRDINLIISNNGERLTLAEEGEGFKRLMGHGLTIQQISQRCGKSITHINNALDFLSAPAEAHALVGQGKVSATLAAKTIRKEGAKKGVETLQKAVETATASGKAKATERHIEPRIATTFDPGPACIALVERLAKESDENVSQAFAYFIVEAREIISKISE